MLRAAALLHRALTVVGVACLGVWGAVTVLAHTANSHNSETLDRLIAESRRAGEATAGPRPAPRQPDGALLGRIDVPRVGVSTVILEGTSERVLEQAVGHIPETALPGEDGNVGLAGHRDSYFRGLRDIAWGDTITLTTPDRRRTYAVRSIQVVDPSDTAVLARAAERALTLVTCYPFAYVGPAPRRFVVLAREVGDPSPSSGASDPLTTGAVQPAPRAARVGPSHHARGRRAPRAAHPPAPPPPHAGPVPTSPPAKLPWWRRLFHRPPKPVPTPQPR